MLARAGIDVVPVTGCCGSIVHHLGRANESDSFAAALVEKIYAEMQSGGLDAVVVNASGCGTHLKDYGFLFRNSGELAEKAAAVSRMTRDITEVIAEVGLPDVVVRPGMKLAYHSACSMQHGQKLEQAPRALLAAAGFEVVEVPEGHLCCGSAGTYNMLQPALATRLRDRKLANIAATGADLVATGNLGCMTQLGSASRDRAGPSPVSHGASSSRPIVHTVELLDWVTGGAKPSGLG